ncbi:MAG: hypothetical protein EBR93_06195, partial [Bacteroidetes bacterium]|nr:hypothetical protein [Bacteroidota bacterium]
SLQETARMWFWWTWSLINCGLQPKNLMSSVPGIDNDVQRRNELNYKLALFMSKFVAGLAYVAQNAMGGITLDTDTTLQTIINRYVADSDERREYTTLKNHFELYSRMLINYGLAFSQRLEIIRNLYENRLNDNAYDESARSKVKWRFQYIYSLQASVQQIHSTLGGDAFDIVTAYTVTPADRAAGTPAAVTLTGRQNIPAKHRPAMHLITSIKSVTADDIGVIVVRPNIEHEMLAIIMGRGGTQELGATFWGQTELSCYDDSQHGIWGMSYKYHARAFVTNERNLIRAFDVSFDGYNGGLDNTYLNWTDPREINEFISQTNDRSKPYTGKSMLVMMYPKLGRTSIWPNPVLWTDSVPLNIPDRGLLVAEDADRHKLFNVHPTLHRYLTDTYLHHVPDIF